MRHKLVLAKESIQEEILNIIPLWTDIRPSCATDHACQRKFTDWYVNLVALASFWSFMALDPRYTIIAADLCATCHDSFSDHAKLTRGAVFARFPSELFDLPEWAALEDSI